MYFKGGFSLINRIPPFSNVSERYMWTEAFKLFLGSFNNIIGAAVTADASQRQAALAVKTFELNKIEKEAQAIIRESNGRAEAALLEAKSINDDIVNSTLTTPEV